MTKMCSFPHHPLIGGISALENERIDSEVVTRGSSLTSSSTSLSLSIYVVIIIALNTVQGSFGD